jgi:hypothetical protein
MRFTTTETIILRSARRQSQAAITEMAQSAVKSTLRARALLMFVFCLLVCTPAVAQMGNQSIPSGSSGAAANGPGIPSYNGKSIFYATNYGVKAGGYKFCDANVSASGTGVVTIGNDANLNDPSLLTLGITTSWVAWVSTWNCSTANLSSELLITKTTVASVQSATQLTLATTSINSCSGAGGTSNKCTLYIFPQDDTTSFNSVVAAASVGGTCGVLHLSSGLMFIHSFPEFAAGCAADNTGDGSWPGLSVAGEGINASVVVMDPTANYSTCPLISSIHVCFFATPASASVANDIHLHDFSIDLGGNLALTTPTTAIGIYLGADSTIENVGIFGGNVCMGLETQGSDNAPVIVRNFVSAGTGNNTSNNCPSANFSTSTNVYGANIFWGPNCLMSAGGSSLLGQTNTYGVQLGFASNASCPLANNPASTFWSSYGDYCSNQEQNAQDCVKVNGTAVFHSIEITSPAGTSDVAMEVASGGLAVLTGNNTLNAQFNSGIGLKIDSGGTVVNNGTITNSSVTPYSISGTFIGAGIGLAAPVTATNLVLSAGWGSTAAVTSPSGANAPIGFTITNSGTGQGASPTITYTFPTPYAIAPLSCTATQTGGTNSVNAFTTTTGPTAAGVTFTYGATPTVSDTEIVQVTCILP